jgi:hypothetical protein
MAQLPPVPKCIQFQLLYSDGADTDVRNMLYFTYTQTLSGTDLVTLCNNVMTEWGTNVAPHCVNTLLLEGVAGNDLSSDLAAQAVNSHPSVPGTGTGVPLTSGAAFVIGYETALKYRGGHSRNYLPGMPNTGLLDANTWTTTFQTAILNAWTAFLSGIVQTAVPVAVGTLQHVVAHRFGKSADAPVLGGSSVTRSVPLADPFTTPVTAVRTNPQVGSQRRRNQQQY